MIKTLFFYHMIAPKKRWTHKDLIHGELYDCNVGNTLDWVPTLYKYIGTLPMKDQADTWFMPCQGYPPLAF